MRASVALLVSTLAGCSLFGCATSEPRDNQPQRVSGASFVAEVGSTASDTVAGLRPPKGGDPPATVLAESYASRCSALRGPKRDRVNVPARKSMYIRTGSSMTGWVGEPIYRGMVYDRCRGLVFYGNRYGNKVEVFSATRQERIATIPVPSPVTLTLSPDGNRVWVGTHTERIYRIDPSRLEVSGSYAFPEHKVGGGPYEYSLPESVVETASGDVLVSARWGGAITDALTMRWDPASNTTDTSLLVTANYLASSRNGSQVLLASGAAQSGGATLRLYSAEQRAVTHTAGTEGTIFFGDANQTGTRFAIVIQYYGSDDEVLMLGPELDVIWSRAVRSSMGVLFSRDGSKLYVSDESGTGQTFIRVFDVATGDELGVTADMDPADFRTHLKDIDEHGMIYAGARQGIAMIEASRYGPPPSTMATLKDRAPAATPFTGTTGTQVTIAGTGLNNPGAVFFGRTAGTITAQGATAITATAPASSQKGAVDISAMYAPHWVTVAPHAFSYGPEVLSVLPNGGPLGGGNEIEIWGYGLGTSASGVTVKFGANNAQIVQWLSPTDSYSVTAPEPGSVQRLVVKVPAGVGPGVAPITVTTPYGNTQAANGYLYLSHAQNYPIAGPATFLTYDKVRNKVYVANGGQVEVFNVTTRTFENALVPPGSSPGVRFSGLTLTPDGTRLVAGDEGTRSVHVVQLANGIWQTVSTAAVSPYLPTRVAATATNEVFIALWHDGSGCGIGCLLVLDLANMSVRKADQTGVPFALSNQNHVEAGDGGQVVFLAIGNSSAAEVALWEASTNAFRTATVTESYDGAAAEAGRRFVSGGGGSGGFAGIAFIGNDLSRAASAEFTEFAYQSLTPVPGQTLHPSGALLYQPQRRCPSGCGGFGQGIVDLYDANVGHLLRRITMPSDIQLVHNSNRGDSLAVDTVGRRIFTLSTPAGLTVLELPALPLVISAAEPSSGLTSGGNVVLLRGSGFDNTVTVDVAGVAVTPTFVDENTRAITMPEHAAGAVKIIVRRSDGASYGLDAAYKYE